MPASFVLASLHKTTMIKFSYIAPQGNIIYMSSTKMCIGVCFTAPFYLLVVKVCMTDKEVRIIALNESMATVFHLVTQSFMAYAIFDP